MRWLYPHFNISFLLAIPFLITKKEKYFCSIRVGSVGKKGKKRAFRRWLLFRIMSRADWCSAELTGDYFQLKKNRNK